MAIAARGAAVASDLFAGRRSWTFPTGFIAAFLGGILFAFFTLEVTMDSNPAGDTFVDPWAPTAATSTTTVEDPAVSAVTAPTPSSEDEELPPPSPYHGILKQIPFGATLHSVVKNMFRLDTEIPGLLRIQNSWDEVLHPQAKFNNFAAPRHFFICISSYTVFLDIELLLSQSQSDVALTRADERRLNRLNVRFFFRFFSPYQAWDHAQKALEHSQRTLSMQSVINDNLERRLAYLENLLHSHGLDTRLPPAHPSWSPHGANTQPEPEDSLG